MHITTMMMILKLVRIEMEVFSQVLLSTWQATALHLLVMVLVGHMIRLASADTDRGLLTVNKDG